MSISHPSPVPAAGPRDRYDLCWYCECCVARPRLLLCGLLGLILILGAIGGPRWPRREPSVSLLPTHLDSASQHPAAVGVSGELGVPDDYRVSRLMPTSAPKPGGISVISPYSVSPTVLIDTLCSGRRSRPRNLRSEQDSGNPEQEVLLANLLLSHTSLAKPCTVVPTLILIMEC